MEKLERICGDSLAEPVVPQWRFLLLGGFRAVCGELTLDKFQTQKTATLLAYLAFHPNKQHSRDHLADMLWPDTDIDVARKRLSQALTWLRSKLEFRPELSGRILLADRQSVWLDTAPETVDVREFLRLFSRARSVGPEAVEVLQEAVEIYRGALLPEMYEDWVFSQREHLQTNYLEVLKKLVDRYEQVQDWTQAIAYARRAIEADPLSETWHCCLMRLLASSGQAEAAIRQYAQLERILAEQLDESPSKAATSLRDEIEHDRKHQLAEVVPVPKAAPIMKPVSRFFGRDAEMRSLRELVLLKDSRLVTVSGIAGSGKSRLVIELCTLISEDFGGRVWFVPLADIRDPSSVPALLRDLFRIAPSSSMPAKEQVARSLSIAPSLLVLDNVEHLSDGVAPFIRELLESTPPLKVLTTSQKLLAISGELEFSLGPLDVPVWDPSRGYSDDLGEVTACASVKLFEDRARCVRPSFTITSQNAGAVTQLCSKLEGLPLAIELCASWAQALTPAQMLSQLMSRFEFLFSRRSDIPVRHRSLHAALEYGFLLLSPEVRDFFVQLSVFRGGCTLEAAKSVCLNEPEGPGSGDTLKALTLLTELRERSLILAEEDANVYSESAMRFRMLEALREFAALQRTFANDGPLRRRHAEYFLRVLESRNSGANEMEESAFINLIESDHENFRAALTWSLETASEPEVPRREIGLRMGIALSHFWELRGISLRDVTG